MSATVHYKGKLKLIEKVDNETLEEQCKRLIASHNFTKSNASYYSWEEMLCDELYDKYVVCNNRVYEILEKQYINYYDDISIAYENEDGTISYEVKYYNGGCCFSEAIEYALDELK